MGQFCAGSIPSSYRIYQNVILDLTAISSDEESWEFEFTAEQMPDQERKLPESASFNGVNNYIVHACAGIAIDEEGDGDIA